MITDDDTNTEQICKYIYPEVNDFTDQQSILPLYNSYFSYQVWH